MKKYLLFMAVVLVAAPLLVAGCTSTSNPSPSPSTATVSATTTAATSQLDKSDPRARAQLTGIDAWKHKRELWAKQKRKLA